MAGRPIWYELMTPDPGAVAAFYRATLGWEIPAEGHSMPNGAEYREITRTDGGHAGGVLTLTAPMAAHGVTSAWFPYFHAEDVDEAVSAAERAGAAVFMPPWSLDGVGRMAMLADPQGASFYLMDPTPPPDNPSAMSDAFDPAKPGHCRWNELNTPDAAGAWRFYGALFDWRRGTSMPMGELGDYQLIGLDGVDIGAVNPAVPAGRGAYWLPVFGVVDIERAKAAVVAHGGSITEDLQEVPGGELVLTATDPGGAVIGFIGRKGA